MKTPYEIRPEGTTTILGEIAMQHMQSSSYYRDIASALKGADGTAAGYFNTFADYHDGMLKQINEIISDMPGGANTPSRTGETYLKKEEESLNQALLSKNVSQLTEIAYENERSLSQAYEQALGDTNLLDFAEEFLHKQHQEVLVWVNRADRYKTVPQDMNEHYDPE